MRRGEQRRMKNVGMNADVAGKNACSTGPQQLADYAAGIFEGVSTRQAEAAPH
jgi:hypothetical protein